MPIQGNIRRLGVTSPPVSPSEARKVTISGTVTPLGRNWARTKQTPKTPTTKIKPVFPCNVPISPRIFCSSKGLRLKVGAEDIHAGKHDNRLVGKPSKSLLNGQNLGEDKQNASGHGYQTKGCRPLSKPTQRTTRQNRFAICVRFIPCIICIASILSLLFVFVIWIVQSKCVWPLWLH